MYIRAASLGGTVFEADSLQVHTYIASLIAGNTKAEAVIQKYRAKQCGHADWKALIAVYRDVGAYKVEIVNAEKVLKTLFYNGEKNGHIKWQTFEQKLVKAFNDVANNSGVRVYDEVAKIKLLLEKTHSCTLLKKISTSIKRSRKTGDQSHLQSSNSTSVSAYPQCTLVNIVEENKKMFTKRQVDLADKARELYRIIGRPGETTFEHALRHNQIHNCPVTIDDAQRAILIYGPDIPKIKGTTTASPPEAHIPDRVTIPVPRSILLHHNAVTLTVNFVFVNRIPFLTTVSRNIGWRTIAPVPNRLKSTMLKELRRLFDIYKSRGLPVIAVHGDNEFACLRDDIGPVHLDIAAPRTHVPEIERSNRTIKERARTLIHGLPYTRLPISFVRHLMMHVVQCLNIFPWKCSVSMDVSRKTIMTGSPPPDYNKLRIEFGSYAQVDDLPTPSNTPRSRTHGAIALGATGNANGTYYFLSLASGEIIPRHHWTICSIQDAVLDRMDVLALHDKQPLIQNTGLIVEWGQDTLPNDQARNLDIIDNDLPQP